MLEANFNCPDKVLTFLEAKFGDGAVIAESVEEIRSAQQRVLIVSLRNENITRYNFTTDNNDSNNKEWEDALKSGCNRVVIRIWKGSSRWWNLNHVVEDQQQNELELLASNEIWGYQSARQAITTTTTKSSSSSFHHEVRIPRVLHFVKHDDNGYPWAILEYVGEYSTLFSNSTLDESWTKGMIKERIEYGFIEPHPRWGRVPTDQCVQYAMNVLHTAICPVHSFYFSNLEKHIDRESYGYFDMINLYKYKYEQFIVQYIKHDNLKTNTSKDQLQEAITLLGTAITQLEKEALKNNKEIKPLTYVLCHIDCQPQNLLFAAYNNNQQQSSVIVSILDWEEAAYADPRFELLMLGRKVCANIEQAKQIWNTYQTVMAVELGPIEPWLKLETVHSLTTLLLQATAGGGRSPWESKPDLVGKIEREFQRLVAMGWDFCKSEKKLLI